MKIIVARYNENIEWTKQLDNIILYNKGGFIKEKHIPLKNVGREGHTYFTYIYDNYDNLDEHTIFLQGNPFDHSPNIINNIGKYKNKKNIHFAFLSETIINCNLSGCKWDMSLPLIDIYEKIFGERKTNLQFQFGAGAQFIVSREAILSRSKEFYLKLIKMLDHDICPLEGYVIERFHKLIFS